MENQIRKEIKNKREKWKNGKWETEILKLKWKIQKWTWKMKNKINFKLETKMKNKEFTIRNKK